MKKGSLMNILERHEAIRQDPSGFWVILAVVLAIGMAVTLIGGSTPSVCTPWSGDVATLFSKLRC
jgi:hypothetical protein